MTTKLIERALRLRRQRARLHAAEADVTRLQRIADKLARDLAETEARRSRLAVQLLRVEEQNKLLRNDLEATR